MWDDTLEHLRDTEELEAFLGHPLGLAAAAGNVGLMKKLLALGASANTTCSDGDCILHKLAARGNKRAVKILLEHGALVNAPNESGRTALHVAVECDSPQTAAHGGFAAVIRTLVRNGTDVDNASLNGSTALHAAALNGNVGAIRVLVKAGADVNKQGPFGAAPLHFASQKNFPESVAALCAFGADRNAKNLLGNTPLKHAVLNGSFSAMEALLDAGGVDVNLRQLDLTETALDVAARMGDVDSVKLLLRYGADVTARDWQGHTALHRAAFHNKAGVIDALVGAGADVHAQGSTDGRTPLHAAAGILAISAARALLRHGASANVPDVSGQSPLHRAAMMSEDDRSAEMVEHLLWWGADESIVDSGGRTPAQRVPADSNPTVLGLLARAPADRAWRRRGVTIMCRSRLNREPPDPPEREVSPRPAKSPRIEGRVEGKVEGGGDDAVGNSGGSGVAHQGAAEHASETDVVTRVAGMGESGVFEKMMGFL